MNDQEFKEQMHRLLDYYDHHRKISDPIKIEYGRQLKSIRLEVFQQAVSHIISTRYTFPDIARLLISAVDVATKSTDIGHSIEEFNNFWSQVLWWHSEEEQRTRSFILRFQNEEVYAELDNPYSQEILVDLGGLESINPEEKGYFRKEWERLWNDKVIEVMKKEHLYDKEE